MPIMGNLGSEKIDTQGTTGSTMCAGKTGAFIPNLLQSITNIIFAWIAWILYEKEYNHFPRKSSHSMHQFPVIITRNVDFDR